MTTKRSTAATLRDYARTYALDTWGMTIRKITADEVLTMEIRADGYSNAHVEGDHAGNGLCSFESATICGLWGAASEFVECTEGLAATDPAATTTAPRIGSHAACTHEATKAARAACRRAATKALSA